MDKNWILQDGSLEGGMCNICKRASRSPISLQCQHKFCRQCLKDKFDFKITLIYKNTINCPICNGEHHLPVSGVHCFDRCFPIEESIKESTKVRYCEQHPSKSLELFCCDCNFDICKMCAEGFHRNHLVEGLSDFETTENSFLEKEQETIRANRIYLQKVKTALDFKRSRIHHFKHAALDGLSEQAKRLKEFIDAEVRTQENAIKEHFRTFEQKVEQDNLLIDEKSAGLTLAEEYLSQMEEYQSDIDSFEKYKKQQKIVSPEEFSSFKKDYDSDLKESFQIGKIHKEQIKSMLGTIQNPVSSKGTDKTYDVAENARNEQFVPNKEVFEEHNIFRNWGDFVRQVSAEEEMFERQ